MMQLKFFIIIIFQVTRVDVHMRVIMLLCRLLAQALWNPRLSYTIVYTPLANLNFVQFFVIGTVLSLRNITAASSSSLLPVDVERHPVCSASFTLFWPFWTFLFTCIHFSYQQHCPYTEHINICWISACCTPSAHKNIPQISIFPWRNLTVA